MTICNPHTETSQAAFTRFKALADDLGSWQLAAEKQGVSLYSQEFESGPIAVRGEYEIQGHHLSARQIMAVASSAGTRKICKLFLFF
jgi:hypothetical protein